jgi:hypothetical protein
MTFDTIICSISLQRVQFQRSLELGKTPSDWKHAIVCPIYKKGPRHLPSNYRPISLTCILCKLMEHIIVSYVMKHLDENKILSEYQHGFRNQRSCDSQLIGLVHDLTSNMDKNYQTDMIAFMTYDTIICSISLQRMQVNETGL